MPDSRFRMFQSLAPRRRFKNAIFTIDVMYKCRIDEGVTLRIIFPGLSNVYILQCSAINVSDGVWLGTSFSKQSMGSQKLPSMASEGQ